MLRFLIGIVSLLLLMSPIVGEEAGELSLQQALQAAYEHNPRVAQARQEVESAKGRWIQAKAHPNPELSLSQSEAGEIGRGSTVGDDSIELSQEIDFLGKIPLKARAAYFEYGKTQQALRRVWSEVAFEVTKTYNELLLSTQRVGVAREVLELSRRLLDQVQLKYNAGEVLRNELLRTQIELARAENGVLETEKQRTLDAASLNVLLGRDPQAALSPADQPAYEPKDFESERLLTQALAQRPDLKASEASVQAQEEQLRLAFRNVFENPTLSALGTRERGETGTESVFGLAVRLPLPLWNRNQGNIQEARAELAKRKVEQEALRRQVGLEVMGAVAEARLALRQVGVWRAAVEQADELMRVASLQYAEGEINFVTYLEHLAAIRETKLNYIQALANYRTRLAFVDQAVANILFEQKEGYSP